MLKFRAKFLEYMFPLYREVANNRCELLESPTRAKSMLNVRARGRGLLETTVEKAGESRSVYVEARTNESRLPTSSILYSRCIDRLNMPIKIYKFEIRVFR